MADKGIGKEYKPEDFKEPAKEVGGGSHKGLWIGLVVVIVLAATGAWFFLGSTSPTASDDKVGAAIINAYCVDSDGGYNRQSAGVAAGTYSIDYREDEFADKCTGSDNKLTEYYCKNDLVVFTTEPCPEGTTCTDGACQ